MAVTPLAALTLDSKNAIATSNSEVCLRYSKRETPCFCHVPNMWPRVAWRESNSMYTAGDTYLNSLDSQVYTYTAGKNGYPNFWQPNYGLMCPVCLQKRTHLASTNHSDIFIFDRVLHGYYSMLSVVCNTWPPYSDKWEGKCCCGHPWLKTATEDYVRWQNGESDFERQCRREYPTIRLWEKYKYNGAFTLSTGIMGVDQAAPFNTLHYHYRRPGGRGDGIANWSKLADIMRDRQIHMCVIDSQPEISEAIKFQKLFPGHVILCQYRQSITGRPFTESLRDTISADRSYWYRGNHPEAYCEIARELECHRKTKGVAGWLS